jgi:F420-dependent oxidoreductase-like protein
MTVFGVHVGLQHSTMDTVRSVWRRADQLGFGWVSIWDHFYAATFKPDDAECFEAVASHAALACDTTRVRCGSLVYCAGYRHPAVLAKAITAIDHLSGGRVDVGLGAGWAEVEYKAYGITFPPVRERMDLLEEYAACVRGLLHGEVTTFKGEYFQLDEARNEPRPVQRRIPIWIGGGGEQRTLKITARYADGWNVPFIAPEAFAHKRAVLAEHCDKIKRDPAEIKCAINVGLAFSEESLQQQFGALANGVRPGVLTGSEQQIVDRIGEYVEAGADQVNLALRAPFDLESIERFAGLLKLS